jgi:serine/threonine protein kinase
MGDDGTGRKAMVVEQPTLSLAVTSSEPPAPTARIEVTLGETVGRYQVRRQLGAGGMGQVYLARDVVLGRSVALKVVGGSRNAEVSTEQFLHEARAIARLNHPNIVQLYDFGEYKGGFYLALEYVEGDTLRERGPA